MMKIYVVTSGEWSDYGIDQIFLTKEKADLYVSVHKGSRVEKYETYDDKINENNIYYIYTADYFPETGEFYVLPVNVEEYYEDIEKLERFYHTPKKVFKKRIELEDPNQKPRKVNERLHLIPKNYSEFMRIATRRL